MQLTRVIKLKKEKQTFFFSAMELGKDPIYFFYWDAKFCVIFYLGALRITNLQHRVLLAKFFSLKDIQFNRREHAEKRREKQGACVYCRDWIERVVNPLIRHLLLCFNLFLCDSASSAAFLFHEWNDTYNVLTAAKDRAKISVVSR